MLRSRPVDRSGETEQRDLATSGPVTSDASERAALITFLAVETVALVIYVAISRPMWFYLDEWDFLADRSATSLHDLLRPHNEHWQTLPILAYRAILPHNPHI